jgi:hypothetical protein
MQPALLRRLDDRKLFDRQLLLPRALIGVHQMIVCLRQPRHELCGPLQLLEGLGVSLLWASQCTARGGRFTAETNWMVHAWIRKDSPAGVFSPTNPLVK